MSLLALAQDFLSLSIQSPFAENEELQQRSVRILGINTWDLALELTNFDWSLFNAIHEVNSIMSTSKYITIVKYYVAMGF